MKRMSCGIAIGIVCLVGAPLSAQAPAGGAQQPPQRFTNLQVWPKDTSPAVIMQFMNAFGDSLGPVGQSLPRGLPAQLRQDAVHVAASRPVLHAIEPGGDVLVGRL